MRNSQDMRPVVPTSTGSFQIPGLGLSSLPPPLPPAPNAAASAAAAGAALAQHPALANLSHSELTALLGQLQSGQNLSQPLSQAQPSSGTVVHPFNAAQPQAPSNGTSHDTAARGGSSGHDIHRAGDSSLEEGEVSDASMDLDSPVISRPSHSAGLKRKHDVAETNGNRKAPKTSKSKNVGDQWIEQAMSHREEVLPFILSLHHEGFSFTEILREVHNEKVLQSIYTELGLPFSKRTTTEPAAALLSPKTSEQAAHQSKAAIDRAATVTIVGKNSPKATAPVDRNEYLARLSQLKAAKSANVVSKDVPKAKPVVPQPSVEATSQNAAPKPTSIPESPMQVVKEQEAAQTKKLNTERLKQKLEMLKAAEQKKRELAAAQVTASAPQVASETKQTDTSTQGFTASVESGSARKRPVASDFMIAEAETPGFSRPFGQSRQNSDDEAMIIEASDDDSDEEDEDEESYNEAMTSGNDVDEPSIVLSARRQRVADFPPLTDFPPRSPFNRQTSTSNVRTPLAQTPGAISEAEALLKHEQELAMLKIRIAEAEKRRKGTASKSGAISDAAAGEMLKDISNAVQIQAQSGMTGTSSGNVTPLASGELSSSIDPDKRTLLRAKLSARDIAANAKKARLAEMQRQVELLQKEYEQDMLEQEQLREELEAFNVDTEGMSKEEMEAKKDEIVQQLGSQTEPAEQQSVSDLVTQPPESIASSQPINPGFVFEQTEPDVRPVVSTSVSEAAPARPATDHDGSEEEMDVAEEHTGQTNRSTHELDKDTSSSSETNTTREDESEEAVSVEDVQPTHQDGSGSHEHAPSSQELNGNATDDEEADMDIEDTSEESDNESSSSSSSGESDEAESSEEGREDESRAVPADDQVDKGSEVDEVDDESGGESDGDAPMDVSQGDSDDDSNDEEDVDAHEVSASSKAPSAIATSLHSTNVSTPIPADDIAPELQYLEHPAERPSLPAMQGTPPPVRPNQTAEDDRRFRDGLRVVLNELRAQGLTQLDDIAKRMTQYRREYLNNYSLGYDQHAYVPTDA
ncbi:hypothetical protein MBLNU457_4113t2 [Dothideomycetes sp. NU457]